MLMTAQTTNIHIIAKLSAIAIVLHTAEFFLPSPIFGLKPGIANIVVLFTYYYFNVRSAAYVSLIRVFISSLILGTFLTPTFFLSFSGAIFSLGCLAIASYCLKSKFFSIYSFSMIMSLGHIVGQFVCVRLFIIQDNGVFFLLPIFITFAFIFAVINAYIVDKILRVAKSHIKNDKIYP